MVFNCTVSPQSPPRAARVLALWPRSPMHPARSAPTTDTRAFELLVASRCRCRKPAAPVEGMLDYYLLQSLGAAQIKITKPGVDHGCAEPRGSCCPQQSYSSACAVPVA